MAARTIDTRYSARMERDPFTAALHADEHLSELPDVAPALRPSTTYRYDPDGRVYRREGDETTERLEAVLGALDEGHAVVYPSGMAAVAGVLRHIRPARISLPDDVYHGTKVFVESEAEKGMWAIVPPDQLRAGDVRWVETPSNPLCLLTDLADVAARSKQDGIMTVADATFATPVLQRTLSFGIDFVVHASTKFIAGHSDAMGGVAVSLSADEAAALRANRQADGAVPGTFESWLTLRGVRTLPLRVERQSATAMEIAQFLFDNQIAVWYPGLSSHPGHEVAARQMSAFGGIVSFQLGSELEAAKVVDRLRVFVNATSLGGVESLAELRVRSDPHVNPGLIRLSVGLESASALKNDLAQALGLDL